MNPNWKNNLHQGPFLQQGDFARDLPVGISRKPGDKRGYEARVGRSFFKKVFPTLHEAVTARAAKAKEYKELYNLEP